MAISIDVQRASRSRGLPDDAQVQVWVRAALDACDMNDGELTVRWVDLAEGAELNQRFRGGERATNVLSFECEAGDATWPPLLGDVIICAPVCRSEARAQAKSVDAHAAHLVIHGVLHLLGYDHQNDIDAEEMESLESAVMTSLDFPDPYLPAAPSRGAADEPRTRGADPEDVAACASAEETAGRGSASARGLPVRKLRPLKRIVRRTSQGSPLDLALAEIGRGERSAEAGTDPPRRAARGRRR